ncbi:arylsulfatase [Niabella ginsengisoli]|uniref:Arylsulfatase n=1 Tax=Niabella ginsengisoli TaxID=522298 RepID=A0ABS9SF78_9BACT|nr:arylsulfatase [Niabella ginsengisoli]MCH5597013.1 arylsulfatase [Niabella ginsengisoli]
MKKTLFVIATVITAIQFSQAQPTQPQYQGKVGKTLEESKEWWGPVPKAPEGAPNVVLILLDDVGYGGASAFGGLINTPTLERLANNGLRYTNFHTTAICAPTRSALLTGRNSHFVHVGGFSHIRMSAGFPGWDGRLPSTSGTIAEILRDNGYNTFAVGKYGITPDEEATDAGPFDRWPTGKGFEHFFGFLGSATDQYKPDLVEDNAHVAPDGRHLNEQITDKAISYIERQKKNAPNKPFFLYYAPGATHSPHQVDKYWSDQYKGKFDEGWDVYREKVLANQKKLGVIPSYAQLPERNKRVKAWNSLAGEEQKLFTRFFEVYAGYLTYTDYQIGRLVNYLRENGLEENTLVYVIVGDNGASKEGTVDGVINPGFNDVATSDESEYLKNNLTLIDSIGTASAKTNYPLGWAQATNTPFKDWKQDAQSEGGTHNPLIVYHPKLIKEKGGIRNQYGHVIDILPTTLEVAGIDVPQYIRGIPQDTIQGTSLAYSVNDAKAKSKHTIQHYYIFGSRAIYKDGWKAGAAHSPDAIDFNFSKGNEPKKTRYEDDVWTLYNLNEDFNERVDLAKKHPEKLAELKRLFDEQAEKNRLYPLIDRYDVNNKLIHHPNGSNEQGPVQ